MTALLALWLCALCVGAIYYSIPPGGMRQNIYDVALSSGVLAVSATVLVWSAWSRHGGSIQPKW
jgi:hypothetical protein